MVTVFEQLLAPLSAEDRQVLHDLLVRVAEAAGGLTGPPAPGPPAPD